jgi:hypothetical protein
VCEIIQAGALRLHCRTERNGKLAARCTSTYGVPER